MNKELSTSDDLIALVDLDGTVADYDKAMRAEMAKLASPGDPELTRDLYRNSPPHIEARRKLVKNQPGFWRKLPRLELGFDVVEELRRLDFSLHVLTKGPKETTAAWTEKVEWCRENMSDALVTISQDKSLVYGKVLVDDWPEYFLPWLEKRPRGLVITVAQAWNVDIDHPNVFRYDGSNRDALKIRIQRAFDRKSRETL